jgi:predicted MPP superfamily phosphohydrolase
MVSLWRLVAVVALVSIVYTYAVLFLLRYAIRWVLNRSKILPKQVTTPVASPYAKFTWWLQACIFALAGFGLPFIAYAWLIEPYWPDIRKVSLPTAKLASATRPVRLVLISDLHSDPKARLEPRLPGLVAGLKPDVIIFAGDAINSDAGLPVFRECMKRLVDIAPVYAVRGNWDVWWFSQTDFYSDTGVTVLDGAVVRVPVAGDEIWIAGARVDSEARIPELVSQIPSGRYAVVVHHFPETAEAAIRAGADLVLSGDTHGGQVRLPLAGALVHISRFGAYYDMGLHKIDGGCFYVNRGIGMEGGMMPRMRFLCRPEITLIELTQGK